MSRRARLLVVVAVFVVGFVVGRSGKRETGRPVVNPERLMISQPGAGGRVQHNLVVRPQPREAQSADKRPADEWIITLFEGPEEEQRVLTIYAGP